MSSCYVVYYKMGMHLCSLHSILGDKCTPIQEGISALSTINSFSKGMDECYNILQFYL